MGPKERKKKTLKRCAVNVFDYVLVFDTNETPLMALIKRLSLLLFAVVLGGNIVIVSITASEQAQFTPSLVQISPASGPVDGGDVITVSGLFVDSDENVLSNGVACQFGELSPLIDAVVINARTIQCTTRPNPSGSVSFKVFVNNVQWTNTALSFTFYDCNDLNPASSPCTSCFTKRRCGICLDTMECGSDSSCPSTFSSSCPVITDVSPNTASIRGQTALTITMETNANVAYECFYGNGVNAAAQAVVLANNMLRCTPAVVPNWEAVRQLQREMPVDLIVRPQGTGLPLASRSSAVTLFDCNTYMMDCSSCKAAATLGECSYCFDSQQCRYNNESDCFTVGTCSSVSSVSPNRFYKGTLVTAEISLLGSFSSLSTSNILCLWDTIGSTVNSNFPATYVNSGRVYCSVPNLPVGPHTVSLGVVASGINRILSPGFTFYIYDCSGSCASCLDSRPECVFCEASATCLHQSAGCGTALTTASNCPMITSALPASSPIAGNITTRVTGSFNTAAVTSANVECVWTKNETTTATTPNEISSGEITCQSTSQTVGTGSVSISVINASMPWTNSVPYHWYDCDNIVGSCGDCITEATPTCKWCGDGCASECEGDFNLDVCPTITQVIPPFIESNLRRAQSLLVIGGPFLDGIDFSCHLGLLTFPAILINSTALQCEVPVFLVESNPVLMVYESDAPYTNGFTIETFDTNYRSECVETPENFCSDTCQSQKYCGWCMALQSCVSATSCGQDRLFLDECLEISISPSEFDPKFAETITITVTPELPSEISAMKKRGLHQSGTIQCALSTGEVIDATVQSSTSLSCALPALSADQSVTLSVLYLNATLIAPMNLEVVSCGQKSTCADCSQLSACAWCNEGCVINHRCASPTDCLQDPLTETVPLSTIVPAVIVPIVVVGVGLAVLLLLLKRRKQEKKKKAIEMKNQNQDYQTIDGTAAQTKKVDISKILGSVNDKMKIPYSSLERTKEIGSGSYGKVYLGEWQGAKVAIKVCASVSNVDGFFEEAALTIGLPPHPNVVQTFGISVDGPLPCIVLEYCGGGSLDTRLFDHQYNYSFAERIGLIKGVARGLLHLHQHNIIHRDMAARNILLTKTGKPKISDFGMSRLLKEESQKGQTKTNVGPIRWMVNKNAPKYESHPSIQAPESLREMSYSTKSDIWSFGIFAFEALTGSEPHTDMDPFEVAIKIKNENYHPAIPNEWSIELKNILISCWHPIPASRPSMEEICRLLKLNFAGDENSE